MVGILIIAHGTLGESLIHSASHVMGGRPAQLMQIGVGMHDDPQSVLPQANKLVRALDEGSGVLVLSDVYGATPSNIACRLLIPGKV
jgi:PTS system mannose-specific IIA component